MFTFQQWLNDFLVKAAGHKYIKRIPYQSGGKLRYRYIYNVTHTHQGRHMNDPTHLKAGTKVMWSTDEGKEFHVEIKGIDADGYVIFEYDDGPKKGETDILSTTDFMRGINERHDVARKVLEAQEKERRRLQGAREGGASEKQIARLAQRVKALGGATRPRPLGLSDDTDNRLLLVAERVESTLDMIPDTEGKKAKLRGALEKRMGEVVDAYREERLAYKDRQSSPTKRANQRHDTALKKLHSAQSRINEKWKEALALVAEENATRDASEAPDLAHARMMVQTGGSKQIGQAEHALYRHINNKADEATDAETRDRLRDLAQRFADASIAFKNEYGSREDRAKKKHAKRLIAWEALKEFGGEDEAPVYDPPEERTQKREPVRKPSKTATDLLTASKKADTLKDGKRTRASFAADKKLIEHMGEVLDKLRSEIDPPDMTPVGERTPKQNLYARLRGAVSTLRNRQKLPPRAYGTSQEDYKSDRAKARETILSVLNNLPQHGAGK